MKAIAITGQGGLEKVAVIDIDRPSVGPQEVLIETRAVALNHLDLFVRNNLETLKLAPPHVAGADGAGLVAGVGAEVSRVKVGDRVLINPGLHCGACEFCQAGEQSLCVGFGVMGEACSGTFAEYFKVPQANVHPVPEGFSWEEAAAFPLVFVTAWRMLISKAAIKPGEDILILGIGGGVSTAVLQIVKAIGLRAFVTSSSDDKLQQAKKLGADAVINYKTQDFAREVRHLTNRRGVDIVVDSVGGDSYGKSLASLVKGGRLVTCGATAGPRPQTDLARIFWNQLSVFGSTMGNMREFVEMLNFVAKRGVKPVIDQVFPLADGAKAFARMEEGQQFGKIVLKVGEDP
ncbi:MAG TPA: zinc-binding dehydrogenase [Candidatus Tectomicrobia bacterium]|nr:zinc-binding dehydrogenase [Candidatus Tectomicrobia bacterium]